MDERMKQVINYQKLVSQFRKDIPPQYNQIELVDELMNKDLDFYISISNRSDGKTFNYVSFFMWLAVKLDLKFMLIARHYTLRAAYRELLYKIVQEHKYFNPNEAYDRRTDDYIIFGYGESEICLITDLNNATDLKYHSNFIKEYPIIVYDEFLALESDYLPDEWDKLKTVYESVDRNHGQIPYIEIPKIFLLGNAVNFSSPILANLNIFNELQKQKINSKRQTDNILVELRRNDFSNEHRNTRAFNSDNDAMTTGEFDFNDYAIADEPLKNHIASNGDYFFIKIEYGYLKVSYSVDDLMTNIKAVPSCDDYQFTTHISDVKKDVIYLTDKYYSEFQPKKYYKHSQIFFDNAYTKNLVLNNDTLLYLNIKKLIKIHLLDNQKVDDFTRKEKVYQDNYIERTKQYLMSIMNE